MTPLLDRYQVETLKNSPLVFYRMREGSGTTMIDFSSNANNGTYAGSGVNWTSLSTSISAGYTRANGRDCPLWNSHYGTVDTTQTPAVTVNPSVISFDGTAGDATATLGTINTSAASKVTVEMWVKWDGVQAGTNGTFEALANFGGATGLLLGFLKNVGASDWRFGLSVRNAGDLWGLNNATTLALFSRDMYHHVVFVIVNNAVQTSKLYIDGVQYTMTQQIGTSTTTKSVTSALALGFDGTASFFGGSVSEVAVYNGEPFDATTVKNRYNIGAYGGTVNEPATLPGIESKIELYGFNNVWTANLNVQSNGQRQLDQYSITEIGGMDDPDIRMNEDTSLYRDGTIPLISRYGGRTITIQGFMEASNTKSMRQLQNKLKSTFSGIQSNSVPFGLTEYPLVFRNIWDNGFDFLLNVRKSTPLQMREAQNTYIPRRDFLVTLRSSYPYFESVGARTEVMMVGATTTLYNKGNAPSYPIVTFWGPFTDLRFFLGNFSTVITGTVAASTSITVDSKNKLCTDWAKLSTTLDFVVLPGQGGNNSAGTVAQFVSVAGSTAGVTRAEVTWRHAVI